VTLLNSVAQRRHRLLRQRRLVFFVSIAVTSRLLVGNHRFWSVARVTIVCVGAIPQQ
jgi:hypothetical protein